MAIKEYDESTVDYDEEEVSYDGGVPVAWWKDSDVDSDYNNGNNHNTMEDGSGASGFPSTVQPSYFSDTASPNNSTASANAEIGAIAFAAADTGGSDGYTGVFTDGGFQIKVNGPVLIPNISGIIVSTGIWIQNATGNIQNPNFNNRFKELQFSDLVGISTILTDVWMEKVNIGDCTINDGSGKELLLYVSANDFWIQHASAVINIDVFFGINTTAQTLANAVNLNSNLSVTTLAGAASRSVSLNGAVTCLLLKINSNGNGELTTTTLGNNLIATGIVLGLVGGTNKDGLILMGAGTHSVAGDIAKAAGTTPTQGGVNWGSGRTSISGGGNLDLTDLISTPGTAVVEFTGAVDQNLTLSAKTIYNLEVDKVSDSLLVTDNGTINSLIGTRGTLKSDSGGVSRVLTAAIQSTVGNMTIQDISMGSANKVNAKAATNTSGGNNLGVVFADSFGDM